MELQICIHISRDGSITHRSSLQTERWTGTAGNVRGEDLRPDTAKEVERLAEIARLVSGYLDQLNNPASSTSFMNS